MPLSEPFRTDRLSSDTIFEPICMALWLGLGKFTKNLRKANNSFVTLVYLSTYMKQLCVHGTNFSDILNWVFLVKSAGKKIKQKWQAVYMKSYVPLWPVWSLILVCWPFFMKVTIVSVVVIVVFLSIIAMVTNISSRRNVGQLRNRWTDQHPWRWSKPGWLIPFAATAAAAADDDNDDHWSYGHHVYLGYKITNVCFLTFTTKVTNAQWWLWLHIHARSISHCGHLLSC